MPIEQHALVNLFHTRKISVPYERNVTGIHKPQFSV